MIVHPTWTTFSVVALAFLATLTLSAHADETVTIGGSRAVLIRPAKPRASVILMPGGSGAINAGEHGEINGLRGNQLVRTRSAYATRGLAVLVVDAGVNLSSAVQYMAAIKRPVTVVATSRGTQRAAEGIAAGARPDALVLTSGFLSAQSGSGSNVMS
ncbi:MAG: alpha/beta hydrolase, partial [Bradyrhizobiaceae bacterium]